MHCSSYLLDLSASVTCLRLQQQLREELTEVKLFGNSNLDSLEQLNARWHHVWRGISCYIDHGTVRSLAGGSSSSSLLFHLQAGRVAACGWTWPLLRLLLQLPMGRCIGGTVKGAAWHQCSPSLLYLLYQSTLASLVLGFPLLDPVWFRLVCFLLNQWNLTRVQAGTFFKVIYLLFYLVQSEELSSSVWYITNRLGLDGKQRQQIWQLFNQAMLKSYLQLRDYYRCLHATLLTRCVQVKDLFTKAFVFFMAGVDVSSPSLGVNRLCYGS